MTRCQRSFIRLRCPTLYSPPFAVTRSALIIYYRPAILDSFVLKSFDARLGPSSPRVNNTRRFALQSAGQRAAPDSWCAFIASLVGGCPSTVNEPFLSTSPSKLSMMSHWSNDVVTSRGCFMRLRSISMYNLEGNVMPCEYFSRTECRVNHSTSR